MQTTYYWRDLYLYVDFINQNEVLKKLRLSVNVVRGSAKILFKSEESFDKLDTSISTRYNF